ncbi:MAG: hypothetical protein WCX82_01610 [archaeon]|jgi:type IV secretory pathway ATPase VirB11/archaellum biosynthesis ATPase
MVEIKKLERIKIIYDPNKNEGIVKTIFPKFSASRDKLKAPSNYQHKVTKIIPKLNIPIKKENIPQSQEKNIITLKLQKQDAIISKLKIKENLEIEQRSQEILNQTARVENDLKFEIEKKRLEVISNNLSNGHSNMMDGNLEWIVENNTSDVDALLESLRKETTRVDDENPFLESISFLGDKPMVEKIPIKNMDVSNLYAKIDSIENKVNNSKIIEPEYITHNLKNNPQSKSITALIEEIEIPEMISLMDDSKISQVISNAFSSNENRPEKKKNVDSSFVIQNKQIKPNPEVEQKINAININSKNLKINLPQGQELKEQIAAKAKTTFDYLLPADSKLENRSVAKSMFIESDSDSYLANTMPQFTTTATQNLIYAVKPNALDINKSQISEKYNINEFTFVNISYQEKQGLFYNLIQPNLTAAQEETYSEIKKVFLDSIDSNYLSFKGDKQNINNYIQKIFDLTINKLTYTLTDLEKKLYLNFINQDFSGLGFLANVLEDKNVLEVSCSGENIPLTVYHLKYGALQTNLVFENISKLNLFVLAITKTMGLQVNSSKPIINGNLPNGYRIEGLYSVGDTSNKGSSFVIKKYLEDPLTPVNLINLGIGTTDIFAYIWAIMNQEYQVVITGGDSTILLSALAQFYPDKKITSIQSFDYIKLPQRNWIKRLMLDDSVQNRKTIISQIISQRPDYLILDNFTEELFEIKWYEINLMYMDKQILENYLEKAKTVGVNLIVIDLERINTNNLEQMQFSSITEIYRNSEHKVITYLNKDDEFHINLVSSSLNIVDYNKYKRLLRWLVDSEIVDSYDFNNIVNDYYLNKDQLFNKLNIQEEKN